MRIGPSSTALVMLSISAAPATSAEPSSSWIVGEPVLLPGERGCFDETAVKDPSIVFSGGQWHVFYTARGRGEYTTGYVSAKTLDELNSSRRHELKRISGARSRYACAPQVFFFQPRNRWYLLFQTRDSNYQPAYSTTEAISGPASWSKPEALLKKNERTKWIDFWVICDETTAYLFYTRGHRDVYVRATTLEAFPEGWGEARKALSGVHEAVHVYRLKDRKEYHMIFELNRKGRRSFGLAVAEHLAGPWKRITDEYATGAQLRYATGRKLWTEEVSHGEAIRNGYDQRLEYEPEHSRWLIQGLMKAEHKGPYPSLPWKLGVIRNGRSGGEQGAAAEADKPRR